MPQYQHTSSGQQHTSYGASKKICHGTSGYMDPLQRPICFRCRDPAINCTCDLKSGRELILPLVHKSEPCSREEGLDLWAIYLDRHPAMHDIDPKRFVADFKKNGFLQALDQEADNFRRMVLDYAAEDFRPMESADIPDKNQAAKDALSLFLRCRWSKMSNFAVTVVHNALGILHRPGLKLTPTLQLIWDALETILRFVGKISLAKSYCLETYPPIYQDSFQHKVYSLSQPPAKASYNGLSLSAYEALMDALMRDEMYEASVITTVCVQARVSIEEAVTWKYADQRDGADGRWVVIKQSASRVCAKRDIILPRLANACLCPTALMAIRCMVRAHQPGAVSPLSLVQTGQASDLYLLANPDNPLKPVTPNSIKKQIVKGLAKISVKAQPYEIQSLLDATYTNCCNKMYRLKEGRRCELCKRPASTKCGKCREVSYCSKECQAKDWKAGHKRVCGV